MAVATNAKLYHSGLLKLYSSSPIFIVPAAWLNNALFRYRPLVTDIAKVPAARGFGMPRDNIIGNTITPMATTAPTPYAVVKIAVTTTASRMTVKAGLSPPNSTAFLIIVRAIPVSTRIRPNQLPKIMLTAVGPNPSGPPWNTWVFSVGQSTAPPIQHNAVHSTAITNRPNKRLPPFAA